MRNDKGSALIIVLVAVAVFSFLGVSLLNVSMAGIHVSRHFANGDKAYYAAEAGIEKAIAYLSKEFNYQFDNELNENETDFFVEVLKPSGNSRFITSTGTAEGKTRTINVLVEIQPLYSNALLSTSNITMHNSNVIGTVRASGSVSMNDSEISRNDSNGINGSVHAITFAFSGNNSVSDWLSFKSDGNNPVSFSGQSSNVFIGKPSPKTYYHSNRGEMIEDGMYDPDLELPVIPPIDFSVYTNDIANNPHEWVVIEGGGVYKVEGGAPPEWEGKKIFINGNKLEIGGSYDENFIFEGLIVVTGQLQVKGQINKDVEARAIFVVDKNVDFIPGQPVQMGGRNLFYSNADIFVRSSNDGTRIKAKGIFIARANLRLRGVELEYNTDMLLLHSHLLPGLAPVKYQWINPNPRR
ncbi:MAG: pilus assembly PilX N-terminal domain-containing protein [Dethiobacter sp.]|jgi:Tfp pilus assembly protein PilX|nr:pilus assembly PilX N-terminal domain-containing protein [Dethiobacter sp.]